MIEIHHDGSLDIAIGKSRRETHWKNTETTWSMLVHQLSKTHRTHETLAEYNKSNKTRQAEIKDVGGFVAGYVNGGRRKSENITNRSALTLDLDFAGMDFWETFTLQYGCAACMYSTHKHTPQSPRLRLIIPLDREVLSDEYVAIARRVAGNLDINAFDDTTFDPSRLMYWPSTSVDGEYWFEYQDGPWLEADKVLATYKDWRNASEWPMSDRVDAAIQRSITKQGDPLEKTGIIGAFCREYDIHTAIETFLGDVYEPVANDDNRYTFLNGSTAGGVVVYEDKFAFSHHGTDPCSGKLVNAFDLVRIHLFGLKDEDAKEGTSPSKLPSFTAMEDMATADKGVRHRIASERLAAARSAFSADFDDQAPEGEEPAEPVDTDWLGELDTTKKGECNATIDNALIILRNDPQLRGLFALNKFDIREIATRHMPWRQITPATRYLKDADDAGIRHYMEKNYELKSRQAIQDAMAIIVEENAFHPVKDYLNALEWDGQQRIDSLLVSYLGAEDNPYTRAVMRKFCVAAVTRIYEPGAKYDYVLTLVGAQGVGKSTFINRLGMQWYSDSFGTIQGKEAYESIQGVWIMEMGELAGLKKAEMETVKHFISKQEDRYRVAYGRRTENFPRQCIFAGTTNNRNFLHDPTGNRRFWPVDVGVDEPLLSIWDDLDRHTVSQIWAEAMHLYRNGESIFLDKEIEGLARLTQEDHAEKDERESLIREYLETPLTATWADMDKAQRREYLQGGELTQQRGDVRRIKVSVLEIWTECYGKSESDLDAYRAKEIRKIMASFPEWEERVIKIRGVSMRGYKRR